MATRAYSFYPGGRFSNPGYFRFWLRGADTIRDGQLVMQQPTAAADGEIILATTTSMAHYIGLAVEKVIGTTTQSSLTGFPKEQATVGIWCDPYGVIAMRTSGSATTGAALTTATPANILVNRTADTTGLTIAANDATTGGVGTVNMAGGLVYGKTGNNGGFTRIMTGHTDSTSAVVIVPFPNTIAVGDQFIRVPWSRKIVNLQLTGTAASKADTGPTFSEANGSIATGTGAGVRILDVLFDMVNSEALVHLIGGDHFYNSTT